MMAKSAIYSNMGFARFPVMADVLFQIKTFVDDETFLSFACIGRDWRKAWRNSPKITRCPVRETTTSMLRECLANGLCKKSSHVCSTIALFDRLDLFRVAIAEGCCFENGVCESAAMNGSLDILRLAVSSGAEIDRDTAYAAATGGHLRVVRWLFFKQCEIGPDIRGIAAENGHFDLLKCIWFYGRELDISVGDMAAKNGHLDILAWAR